VGRPHHEAHKGGLVGEARQVVDAVDAVVEGASLVEGSDARSWRSS
jgi:hypothetical protein